MSDTWSDYMREHGSEEYAAWEAAVKPYTERIAALTQERDSALAIARQAVEVMRKLPGIQMDCDCDECSAINAFLARPDVVKLGGGK